MDHRKPASLVPPLKEPPPKASSDESPDETTVTSPDEKTKKYRLQQQQAWNAIANKWEETHTTTTADGKKVDGTDMFTQCLIPKVVELAEYKDGETILDLGAGSGIIAREFAKKGARVVGLDFSEAMLDKARKYALEENVASLIEYGPIDLMEFDKMIEFMDGRKQKLIDSGESEDQVALKSKFDIITISTTLKSLPDLEPIAKALPHMLKPSGRIVIADLHPAFSKPAGHRGMEVFEDPNTGEQHTSTYIKVPQYLDIKPAYSMAVRDQPVPQLTFHRPFHKLMQPFFTNGFVLDAMREPGFEGETKKHEAQSYHNFQQIPMLLIFRLIHRGRQCG